MPRNALKMANCGRLKLAESSRSGHWEVMPLSDPFCVLTVSFVTFFFLQILKLQGKHEAPLVGAIKAWTYFLFNAIVLLHNERITGNNIQDSNMLNSLRRAKSWAHFAPKEIGCQILFVVSMISSISSWILFHRCHVSQSNPILPISNSTDSTKFLNFH